MHKDFREILLTEEQIKNKVRELGEKITKDYEGKDIVLIGVLKGSVMFMSDLMKEIKTSVYLDFMAVSSYGNSSETSGIVRILKDLDNDIEGKHVLIVEDIIDSGITLQYLAEYLRARNPKSVEIAALLHKPDRKKVDVNAKYLGFKVPDEFLVGYGLDYAEKYRNFPFVSILKEEIYKNK